MASEDKQLKMAIIAGASHALKYKQKNPYAHEDEVLQYIAENAQDILENIDNPI